MKALYETILSRTNSFNRKTKRHRLWKYPFHPKGHLQEQIQSSRSQLSSTRFCPECLQGKLVYYNKMAKLGQALAKQLKYAEQLLTVGVG